MRYCVYKILYYIIMAKKKNKLHDSLETSVKKNNTGEILLADKSEDLEKTLLQSETMSWKLSRLDKRYWDTINKEAKSENPNVPDITEKDVYEADFPRIEWMIGKGTAYLIFNVLKNQGLKIFINPKTDISYTSGYNIILWFWPITQQSRETMGIWLDATDEEVYKTKLVHEMCHSLVSYIPDQIKKLYTFIYQIREKTNVTKLWDLDRYKTVWEKATEDTVEFVRMYVQNPKEFRTYLWRIFKNENTQNFLYWLTENCIDFMITPENVFNVIKALNPDTEILYEKNNIFCDASKINLPEWFIFSDINWITNKNIKESWVIVSIMVHPLKYHPSYNWK